MENSVDSSVSITPPASPLINNRYKIKTESYSNNFEVTNNNSNKNHHQSTENGVEKIPKNNVSLLGNVSAEFYYKQLIAANVAMFGKASSKIGGDTRLANIKNDIQDDDSTDSITSNDDSNPLESDTSEQKSAFVWSSSSEPSHHNHHGHNISGGGVVTGNKCGIAGGGGGQLTSSSTHHTGGAQSQNIVHWMSVMAEHMNNANGAPHHHHEPPMHYMWNGVDCSGNHNKDNDYNWSRQSIMKHGYEGKINNNSDQINHKGGMDENPLSAGSVTNSSPLYNGNGGGQVQAPRSLSSGSSSTSPPIGTPAPAGLGSHMLVVPHPINAKLTDAHHIVTQNTSGRKYQCKMCPSVFSSKSELQLHSQMHMREVKPHKCLSCSKSFANSSYLAQHNRIHQGIKPYHCEICQRKFTQLSHLQQHRRTHTGEKPYRCRTPGCTKAFSQLSNLQSHSRCHETDKPFKCNSCYKCFFDEQSLLDHIPRHKESKHLKTHICQYCGKSYTQETYLTKHMQKHAERLEKRPPIIGIPRVTFDNSHYWPKVSPDTANNLVEAINQHEACLQGNGGISSSIHHQRDMNGNDEDHILRLSHPSIGSSTPSGSSPIHPYEPIITVSTPGAIKTPTPSSSSAFTPIQSMGISGHHHNHHLNHHHHQISDRPYLPYNGLPFPGSKMVGSGFSGSMSNCMDIGKGGNSVSSNAFPNQLISLHHIKNYAHQPPHSLMPSDHFMQGLKDKS